VTLTCEYSYDCRRAQGELRLKIEFEGETIKARLGESLAAALTAHGIRSFRTTERGAERGVFCGMGVCQDCLVEVEGRPNQRACVLKVDRPMKVRRQEGTGRPAIEQAAGCPPIVVENLPIECPDVLVVGAGPGGLSAARAARLTGADTLLLDEGSAPGGQYFKQCSATDVVPADAQHSEGRRLIDDVVDAGVVLRSNAVVWGAFPPLEFAATIGGRTVRLQPRKAIIATGAYDRGWPVPGWTLPGVITTGAAQTLWRTARRLPGERILIAGNGPLNLQLAAELAAGGAHVVAMVEAAPRPGVRRVKEIATMLASAPSLVADGVRYLFQCWKAGVQVMNESVLTSVAARSGGGLLATVEGREVTEFEVDVVCLGYGFHPSNELLRALGCSHEFDPGQGRLATVRNARGATSVEGVWALGDCTTLGGARVGMAEGTIAGFAASRSLGRPLSADALRLEAQAMTVAARHRRFQAALWQIYRQDKSLRPRPTNDTVICRCEEVVYGRVEEALAEGLTSPAEIKQRTRLGMGRCQGRYCGPELEALLAERTGRERNGRSGFAPRVPVKPVAVADLSRPADG
jgi:NADPH-dependent 2,4-dienoyl-CoA reductase/sulfur reductase-like enzyme